VEARADHGTSAPRTPHGPAGEPEWRPVRQTGPAEPGVADLDGQGSNFPHLKPNDVKPGIPSAEQNLSRIPEGFELRELTLHGHRMAYRSAGAGPVVMLLHGITSSSATWERVLPTWRAISQ
jgi:hypothetical protein